MAESVYPPGPTGYYKDPVTTQIYVHGMGKKDKTEYANFMYHLFTHL